MKTNIIRALLQTPGFNGRIGLPTVYEGKPGVGKSSIIAQVVGEMGLQMETVLASLREPSDFLGLPIPARDGGVTYSPPAWAKRMAELGEGVVFFDEINTAPPSVQAALLRVILEGVVGDLVLPPGVRFIAAMNSVEDAAGGWDLPPPLANRLVHLKWTMPTVSQWSQFMTAGPAKPEKVKKGKTQNYQMDNWDKEYAAALGEVVGFLHAQNQHLHAQPDRSKPASSGPWPSPRTWEMASRAIAGGRIHGLDDKEIEDVSAGCVGRKAAADLHTWKEEADLPRTEDLLNGSVVFKPTAKRPDKSAAVIAGCCALLGKAAQNAKTLAQMKIFADIAHKISESAVDVTFPAMRFFLNNEALQKEDYEPLNKFYSKVGNMITSSF